MIIHSNMADALTGERIFPGEEAIDTGLANRAFPYQSNGKTKVVKEDTIVRLAEAAGYVVTKRDGVVVGDSENVDGSDVGVGGGEGSVGEVAVGGKSASKRRSDGPVKD
jgi:hypothetical protein